MPVAFSIFASAGGFFGAGLVIASIDGAEIIEQDGQSLLLSEARRQEIYVEWLRRSVKKADQIIAELEQREE